jgi:NADH-quinone oxidoreductase subunit A
MNAYLLQYLPIVIFLGIACALGVLFTVLPTIIAPKAPDAEKLSAYECRMPHEAAAYAFWSMMAFLSVLTVGFIYEWKKGALEWE